MTIYLSVRSRGYKTDTFYILLKKNRKWVWVELSSHYILRVIQITTWKQNNISDPDFPIYLWLSHFLKISSIHYLAEQGCL